MSNSTVSAATRRAVKSYCEYGDKQDRQMLVRTLTLAVSIDADGVKDKDALADCGVTADSAKRAGERLSRGRSIMRQLDTVGDVDATIAALEQWNKDNGTSYWSVNTLPSRLKADQAAADATEGDATAEDAEAEGGSGATSDPVDVIIGLLQHLSVEDLVRVEAAVAARKAAA